MHVDMTAWVSSCAAIESTDVSKQRCVLQEWQDERLTWNPADFGNVSDIIVRADKLWLPELAVMNGSVPLHDSLVDLNNEMIA